MTTPVTQAALVRTLKAIRQTCGRDAEGIRLSVDGSVTVFVTMPEGALPEPEAEAVDWVALAGEKEVPRARRA